MPGGEKETTEQQQAASAEEVMFLLEVKKLKRKLEETGKQITCTCSEGRKAVKDPRLIPSFLAMYKGLDRYLFKFEDIWEQLIDAYENEQQSANFPSQKETSYNDSIRKYYYECVSMATTFNEAALQKQSTSNINNTTTFPADMATSSRHLPKMNLPEFDGETKKWPKFRDSFLSIVDNDPSLSDMTKFHYLTTCLRGAAEAVISHLPLTAANYTSAWEAVVKAYDNKRLLASSYLNALLDFPPMSKNPTPEKLNEFLSQVSESISAFQRLRIPEESEFILYHLASRNIDNYTREQFELQLKTDEYPTYKNLSEFIRLRSRVLQVSQFSAPKQPKPTLDSSFHHPTQSSKSARKYKGHQFKTTLLAQGPPVKSNRNKKEPIKLPTCPACGMKHNLYNCSSFVSATVDQRLSWLKGWNGCRTCLRDDHYQKNCSSKWSCRFCKSSLHHSLLHQNSASGSSLETKQASNAPHQPANSHQGESSHFVAHLSAAPILSATSEPEAHVLLGTAVVKIEDCQGVRHSIRLVVDCGSQHSFITSKCARKLGLFLQKFRNRISGIGQVPFLNTKGKVACTLFSAKKEHSPLRTNAVVVDAITTDLPHFNLPPSLISIYKNYHLADPLFGEPRAIDFLLGADLYLDFIIGEAKEVVKDGPKLVPSICGNIVMGKLPALQYNKPYEVNTSLFISSQSDSLQQQVEHFWQLEEPCIKIIDPSPLDVACEEHFRTTHQRNAEGRYIVRLPFSSAPPDLLESNSIALKRFSALEKKLSHNNSSREQYVKFMEEYFELGHMNIASSPALFTLAHHSVMKEGKIRVVFDASMKTKHGSLNNYLMIGPKLHRDSREILLNFRIHLVVFVADIIKMFRQVLLDPRDRPFQHIRWRFDQTKSVESFELNTITYGMAPAPYLAQRSIHQLTIDEGEDFPGAVEVLLRDMYMDDLATGADSLEEACELQDQVIKLLAKGCFQLGKWASNSKELLDRVEDVSDQPLSLACKGEDGVKLLGLQWDPNKDMFFYDIKPPKIVFTKRGILSSVAKFYDPLGFLSPVIFTAKVLIQELWKDKVEWDQEISVERKVTWSKFCSQLPSLSKISITRFITASMPYQYQIVGFCDASMKGYGCVIYIKVITADTVKCNLLIGKTKLAPTQTISIPRLELCAALLLARTYISLTTFLQTLKGSRLQSYFFSDSQITLAWIKTPPYKLKTFVSHRVTEIVNIIPIDLWYHVGTLDNPSDCSSRGLEPSELADHQLWWHGPSWLLQDTSSWPISLHDIEDNFDAFMKEYKDIKENPGNVILVTTQTNSFLITWIENFSSYFYIIKIVAWLLRFYQNSYMPNFKLTSHHVTGFELKRATLYCAKIVQRFYFFEGKEPSADLIPRSLINLHPFLDEMGVLRVGGRLRHSNLKADHKHPILLPTKCHFTNLLVDYFHKIYLHPGPQLLQAVIQLRFWIPSLRRVVQRRTYLCTTCFRSKAANKLLTPFMGDLPDYRTKGGRAFQHVGVDFAGPFQLRLSSLRKATIAKAYMCVFVCMATKAIHLEMVSSLSTDAFLACLSRFISRRGIPQHIYSDNGTNFVGAANQLRELAEWYKSEELKSSVLAFTSKQSIEWSFQPPHSPHFGGLWEAAVKSSKTIIKKIVGETALTFEEWATLLSKVEAILNSRPLCPISSSPEEIDFLTPGHFLIGDHLTTPPEPTLLDLNINRLSRWQLIKHMAEEFWKRWTRDYLSTLQSRSKWNKKTPNLQPGDIVLIKDSLVPVLRWPLGKILLVHPGADGVVRVATVKTQSTTFKRPVVSLVPLPLEESYNH